MTWTNAFDVGECTVKVMDFSGAELFSQIMAKGDTATADSEALTIAVSSDGAVSLSRDGGFNSGGTDGYSLRVIPSYDIASMGIRASGFSIDDAPFGTYATAFADFDGLGGVDLERSVWTPDPADMSALSPRSEIGVFARGLAA